MRTLVLLRRELTSFLLDTGELCSMVPFLNPVHDATLQKTDDPLTRRFRARFSSALSRGN
jgi:hypothetical protein